MIGIRLKLIRDILDKTQEEFGDLIGSTQSGVYSMESGIYRPSPEYIRTIAQRTGFTPDFLNKGEPPDFSFGSILYRAQAQVKQTPRTRAHAIAHVAFELANDLAGRLKKVPVNIPRLDDDPQTCARITRAGLGLSPNSPIRGFLRCLEKNGVVVFSIPMEVDGFDGFSAWAGSSPARPVIALLQGKTAYREVFTAAEEIAHLVMHFPLRISPADADKEARAFAQELLLPADAMLTEMPRPVTLSGLSTMKARWGVSIAFLAKRAESLNLVTSNQYRYLIQQMNAKWGSKSEPGDDRVEREKPGMLRKMAEMVYPGSPIDFSKLGKESGLPISLLKSILDVANTPGKLLKFRETG